MWPVLALCSAAFAWVPTLDPTRDPSTQHALATLPWADAEAVTRRSFADRRAGEPPVAPFQWGRTAHRLGRFPSGSREIRREALDRSVAAGDWARARSVLAVVEADEGDQPELQARIDRGANSATVGWVTHVIALGGALALGLAAGTRWRRARTDPKPARQLVNPFVTGRPVRDYGLVFGRDALLAHAVESVRAGRGVYLHGERRIGKTTLLLHAGEVLAGAGYRTVFVDVAGTRGAAAGDALRRALVGAVRGAGLDADGDALVLARRLAAQRPVVLLFDEVDALNHAESAVRDTVRALCIDADSPARFVGAGVGLRLSGDPEAEAWARRIESVEVQGLPDEAARALLTKPLAGHVTWSEAALEATVTAAEGRPLRLQLFGLKLVEHLTQTGRDRIDPADLEAVRSAVDQAWHVIQEHHLDDDAAVPVDLDAAIWELGRLTQEIHQLERLLGDA